jgi:hypothetical protein
LRQPKRSKALIPGHRVGRMNLGRRRHWVV